MGLKPGYKQTEVGVIPDEWRVASFGEVFSIGAGGDVDPKRTQSFQDEVHCHPIYSNALTNYGLYGYCSYTDHPAGSITITARGMVGRANFRDHAYTAIGRVLVLQPKREVAGHYFSAVINDRVNFANESTGVPQLTAPQISKYQLPVPPLAEQRAIAEALSDMDALLGALDRLIAKKRDLKQAAMQQLLTGQTRLPGFDGEWQVKRLAAVCTMKSGEGITSADIDDFSEYPCYGGNGLRGFTKRFTHRGAYALIGRVGALCGNVLSVDGSFFASEHAIVVTAAPEVDIQWLTSVLREMALNQYSESSAQPVLTVSKLLLLELTHPPTKDEQAAIAHVLHDLERELAGIEQRRDKTHALKQAMMQELLTGRTRLV